MADRLPITVVILTKNEEAVVANAIASVRDNFDEVVVLDSLSEDGTQEVVRALGVRVVERVFEGYAVQRNFALKHLIKRNDWVLFLDADELVTPDLVAELRLNFCRLRDEGVGMFFVRRKDYFLGRWIRHSSGYPTWFGRLCHAPSVSVERDVNEEYYCLRPTARLEQHLIHFPFAKGIASWIERHNRYSSAEAMEKIKTDSIDLSLIFSRDPQLRRKGGKQLYMKMPCRPLIGFLYLYCLRGGFLEGKAGFRFALLRAFYELLITIKVEEGRIGRLPTRADTTS